MKKTKKPKTAQDELREALDKEEAARREGVLEEWSDRPRRGRPRKDRKDESNNRKS